MMRQRQEEGTWGNVFKLNDFWRPFPKTLKGRSRSLVACPKNLSVTNAERPSTPKEV